MYLGSDYDSWRLDNGEPSHFACEHCGERKPIEELSHNDDGCNECCAEKLQDELRGIEYMDTESIGGVIYDKI